MFDRPCSTDIISTLTVSALVSSYRTPSLPNVDIWQGPRQAKHIRKSLVSVNDMGNAFWCDHMPHRLCSTASSIDMAGCAALLYGFGEADVAQEVAIWPPAAAGTESHATSLTVYQITQVAHCATPPAARGIT